MDYTATSIGGGEMIIAGQDQIQLIIPGQHGATLVIALFNVELMELKNDSDTVTHRKREDILVHLKCNLIAKLVITDLAQLTVGGVIGENGVSALYLAEELTTPEPGHVITLLQHMVVLTVLVMHLKLGDVTKIRAQLMVVGVSGAHGQNVL